MVWTLFILYYIFDHIKMIIFPRMLYTDMITTCMGPKELGRVGTQKWQLNCDDIQLSMVKCR